LVNTTAYDVNTISNSSVLASEAGYLDQAVLLSLKAIEKNPGDPVTLNNAGAIFKEGGLEIAAVTVLEVANKKEHNNSTIQNNLGQAYLALGEKEKAEEYLKQCISKIPYHPLANSSLALISYAKGNKETALKYTENSLRGAFTDRAWHLLYKLKPDAALMDYFRHRYKQPVYFNEDKYKLPMQCERVVDITAKKAEYEGYREMLKRLIKEFDAIANREMKASGNLMMQKIKNGRLSLPQSPFWELANAMMLAKGMEMNKSEWDKIARSQMEYNKQINLLKNEYEKKREHLSGCGARIALSDEYMQKMSIATTDYQKIYLHVYKDFYHDMIFWGFFAGWDLHQRKGIFCGQASALLSIILRLSETHFLEVETDCASNEKLKKDAEDIQLEGDCPLGKDGYELPFGFGKISLSCERWELEIGEGLVVNVGHKFTTGETSLALGPGVAVSLIGASEESLKHVPELKIGPLQPGLSGGIKGQVFFTFRNGSLMDWGGLFEAELDFLGIAKELLKAGFTIGKNSGLQVQEGPLKNIIDKTLGPDGEAPQINKNVKPYKPQQ
jgi:tetratricopeptide (TPR) repeat protein